METQTVFSKTAQKPTEEEQAKFAREYPELTKVNKLKKDINAFKTFLEWLEEKGVHLGEYYEDPESRKDEKVFAPTHQKHTALIEEYFEIDMKKYHAEQDRLLQDFRNSVMQEPS